MIDRCAICRTRKPDPHCRHCRRMRELTPRPKTPLTAKKLPKVKHVIQAMQEAIKDNPWYSAT